MLHLIRNILAFLTVYAATMDTAATLWKLSDFSPLTSGARQHTNSIRASHHHVFYARCHDKIGPPLNRVATPSTSKIITALGKVGMSVDICKNVITS